MIIVVGCGEQLHRCPCESEHCAKQARIDLLIVGGEKASNPQKTKHKKREREGGKKN